MAGTIFARFGELSQLPLAEVIELLSIPEPNSGCWLWLGRQMQGRDYGRLSYRGRVLLAHRAAWESRNGMTVPKGFVVRHKCDNGGCVNPDHLVAGSQRDNVRDRESRNRGNHPKGETHPFAKLTEADVLAIRSSTESSGVLAKRYGLYGPTTINNIRRGRRWKHIGERP